MRSSSISRRGRRSVNRSSCAGMQKPCPSLSSKKNGRHNLKRLRAGCREDMKTLTVSSNQPACAATSLRKERLIVLDLRFLSCNGPDQNSKDGLGNDIRNGIADLLPCCRDIPRNAHALDDVDTGVRKPGDYGE